MTYFKIIPNLEMQNKLMFESQKLFCLPFISRILRQLKDYNLASRDFT